MNAERRRRMTELFVAVRDALERAAVPTFQIMAPTQRPPRPSYLPEAPAQTPAEYRAALAKLGALGIVKQRVS